MPSLSRDFNEKRNFIRMQVDAPITITTDSGALLTGKCKDLSGGGLLVEISGEVSLGDHLCVDIRSSHGHSPMLLAETTVTRVDVQSEQTYLVGMQIIEVRNETE